MALYDYECYTCGTTVEIRHNIDSPARRLAYCPGCDRMRPVKRLISKTSFILKGEAWAKDGYTRKET